jgi:hypothetical protein
MQLGTAAPLACAKLSQAQRWSIAHGLALSGLYSSSTNGTAYATCPHVKATIDGGVESSGLQLGGALAPLVESAEAEAHDALSLEPLEAMLRSVVFEWRPSNRSSESTRVLWMSRGAGRSSSRPS